MRGLTKHLPCRTGDVGYEAPLPLRAATLLFFIAAGTSTAWLIHAGQSSDETALQDLSRVGTALRRKHIANRQY